MNAGPGDLSWWFDAPMANPLLSLALLAAVGSVALPLVSFVKSRPRVAAACAVLLVAVGVLAVSAGVWVQANELRHVEWALPNASPADRESIR
jgi:predicted PurR-regulated permease PerM